MLLIAGRGDDGQLGLEVPRDAPFTTCSALVPYRVLGVSVGSGHTLVLAEAPDGAVEVLSFGRGDDGRLGHGDALWRNSPKRVEYFSEHGVLPAHVVCGSYHSCVLSASGALFTFGGALFGKLGHGDEEPCALPRPVAALNNKVVVHVACGR
jgi:RCC1 and BTB domain-containing protein